MVIFVLVVLVRVVYIEVIFAGFFFIIINIIFIGQKISIPYRSDPKKMAHNIYSLGKDTTQTDSHTQTLRLTESTGQYAALV